MIFLNKTFARFIKIYGTPLAILLGAVIIALAIKLSLQPQTSDLSSAFPPSGEEEEFWAEVSADDDPFLGDEQAPVLVIEFSDFQCPFCRQFWRETLPRLKSDYIEQGLVRFVYRDFPLSSIHPSAQIAAEAAHCAGEQGQYWQMHDKIFAEQDEQGTGTIPFARADLERWAGELGLAAADFAACLDESRYRDEVEKDLREGLQAGASGTPTFFVNGRRVVGAVPYEQLAAVIEEELAK